MSDERSANLFKEQSSSIRPVIGRTGSSGLCRFFGFSNLPNPPLPSQQPPRVEVRDAERDVPRSGRTRGVHDGRTFKVMTRTRAGGPLTRTGRGFARLSLVVRPKKKNPGSIGTVLLSDQRQSRPCRTAGRLLRRVRTEGLFGRTFSP